jgi:adenylate cyclase
MERRLSAILAADVVGYSALMEQDEAGTFNRLRGHRKELFEPEIHKHHGRIFKLTGDGLFAEFGSVVDAVECAVSLQQGLTERNSTLPDDQHIQVRVGINLGEVIVDSDDRYGEGVNVAARLEQLADPGGICVSDKVAREVEKKLAFGFEYMGAEQVKNIAEPVEAYRVRQDGVSRSAGTRALIDKPSIALLPFVNMSGDPTQDYFADGITENVITGLSRFRDLFVIASNSTFAYKGKATRVQEVSRELGVRYILEGSVQRSKDRARITAQLIDGKTGRHLWAERYDRSVDDIFAVQDEVTERIIGSLATAYGGRLLKAWQDRPEATGTRNLQALDFFVRGMDYLNRFTKEENVRARELFDQAAQRDPKFAKPVAKIAWTHFIEANEGWSEDPAVSLATGLKFAKLAIERDDAEAWGRYALAGYYLFSQQYGRAIGEFEKALELNPNDADILTDFGFCLSYAGRSAEAIDAAEKGMRLNPHYPEWYMVQLGQLYFDARRYEEGISALESLRTIETIYHLLYLAASHAAMGHTEEAQEAVNRVLELDPQATIKSRTTPERAPYKDADSLQHFRANLLRAGLPEE